MGRLQRLRCGHGDVRLHTYAFPAGFGDGIDGASIRDRGHDVVPKAIRAHGIGGAQGGFAHHGAALLRLEVIGAFFGSQPVRAEVST